MGRRTKKSIVNAWIVLPLLMFTAALQYLTQNGTLPQNVLLLRGAIHVCMLAMWGISVHTRIIQTQVHRYMLAITAMMAFWILLKVIKHSLDSIDIKRFLWYLYYIPMLFIPVIALFVGMSLGKAENYRLPLWTKLLYAPSAILFLLVLTNDLHQLAFSFPTGIMTDLCYLHETGYYIALGWIIICSLTSFIMMLIKCRLPHSRLLHCLPLVPLILSLVYTISYIRGVRYVLLFAGDMTIVQCLLIFAVFESCIQCGLIHSNIGYDELLEATTIPVQITGTDFSLRHTSKAMQSPLPIDTLQQMTSDSVLLDQDTLLKRHSLQRGWVFWTEDISEWNQIQEELSLTQDELRDTGNILAAENDQRKKLLRLAEENRLYDMMEIQTAKQVARLRKLLSEIQKTEQIDRAKRLLGQAILIGSYIKRRNNLIFVSTRRGTVSAQELQLCLHESVENLNLYGAECKVLIHGNALFPIEQAMQVYDLFEAVIEETMNSLQSLLLSIEIGTLIEVNICVSCRESLYRLTEQFSGVNYTKDEDDLQYLSFQTTQTSQK